MDDKFASEEEKSFRESRCAMIFYADEVVCVGGVLFQLTSCRSKDVLLKKLNK